MGKIIGYTTGVFDMFHAGHLNILHKASQQCDSLIVGVSTDELCLSYKGHLPIIPFEERCSIVQAIRFVDCVVPQTNRDKYLAWKEIGFNKLFVGDDWKGSPLFEELEDKFRSKNVELIYIPYTQHISSTILRNRILKYNK